MQLLMWLTLIKYEVDLLMISLGLKFFKQWEPDLTNFDVRIIFYSLYMDCYADAST